MITPQLHADDFTQSDVDEFRRLMTELITTCKSVADEHADEGVWQPSMPDLFDQIGESMVLIAEVSRSLNKTRGGIRRITERARERLRQRPDRALCHPRLDL